MKLRTPNIFVRVAAFTGLMLLIPLVGMQLSDSVDWSVADFVIAGLLIGATGLGFELLARSSKTKKQKIIISLVLGAVFVLIWAELAVGLFGTPFAGD